MSKIQSIHARQVLDSRGNPTVEAELRTEKGTISRAIVPSGASTGKHEAVELRDGVQEIYLGKSVLNAVNNVNTTLRDLLIGKEVSDQQALDRLMIHADGTPNKAHLGANAILAASTAIARAAAQEENLSLYRYLNPRANRLPFPLMNILNGGAHADNPIDFQEFMIIPTRGETFAEVLQVGVTIFHTLKKVLHEKGYATNVGDEGGFAPNIPSNEEAMETVLKAIEKAGYRPGEDVYIAMDAASTEMYDESTGLYTFYKSSQKKITSDEMVDFWENWVQKYPIISIEDGMAEDDWTGWKKQTDRIGSRCQLVGDDLFVTNVQRLQRGIDEHIANSILIKINQIGTITETIQAVNLAHDHQYTSIMSHRSGETEDTTIADLAVALDCGMIKTGSASRTDRIAKYNQLLRIEEELGKNATLGTSIRGRKV